MGSSFAESRRRLICKPRHYPRIPHAEPKAERGRTQCEMRPAQPCGRESKSLQADERRPGRYAICSLTTCQQETARPTGDFNRPVLEVRISAFECHENWTALWTLI